MENINGEQAQLREVSAGVYLFSAPQGNVLFGCPPEVLKRILASHLPMPDTVVLPEDLHHGHSSQGSLEFPLYHFLFVQRGLERKRRFQVVGTKWQCEGMANLLRVTVVGPTDKEMVKAGTDPKTAKAIFQETSYWALKNPAKGGKPYAITDMIHFNDVEVGGKQKLYASHGKAPDVWLERTGPATYRVIYGEIPYEIDMTVKAEQTPSYKVGHKTFDAGKGKFNLVVLGRSNGFDPNDPANGYLLNIDGRVVLWDCPAYLHHHLKQMKLDPKKIEALVLSHVHEDHIDTSESLRDPPFDLYTTAEIYYSLLVKLCSTFNCSMEEAKKMHKWHEVKPGKTVEIAGAKWELFHSVHAIPALGCRVHKEIGGKKGLLHISGDHLSDAALATMLEKGGITQARYDEVMNLLTGEETLVLIDAGGGLIHGDFHDYLDRNQRIGFMHTGLIQEDLPKGMSLVKSGEVLNVLGK